MTRARPAFAARPPDSRPREWGRAAPLVLCAAAALAAQRFGAGERRRGAFSRPRANAPVAAGTGGGEATNPATAPGRTWGQGRARPGGRGAPARWARAALLVLFAGALDPPFRWQNWMFQNWW